MRIAGALSRSLQADMQSSSRVSQSRAILTSLCGRWMCGPSDQRLRSA
jgi:hypothetical protein